MAGPSGLRPLTYADLQRHAKQWPVSSVTPEGVAEMLATVRALYALAAYHYELYVVAATWSLLAVEAALGQRYDDRDSTLEKLLKRARSDGQLDDHWFERLDHGRELRNRLIHGRSQDVWTPAMAAGVIQASHEAISRLFSAAAVEDGA